jgi:nucleotide-binding universal stress UspA family protein
VTAALPLLRLAERVEVVGWSQAPLAGRFSGIDIERYLARHGVAANVVRRAPTADVGAEIAQVAARIDADLVVMGCFGHGRLRERVLGGATRSILHAMSVPTVMVH